MTRPLILVWADPETGEVMNPDGTVAGKIVPNFITYQALFANSKVDLSSAAVKLPKRKEISPFESARVGDRGEGHNACLDAITATMPKDAA